jgi:hypothetical protein
VPLELLAITGQLLLTELVLGFRDLQRLLKFALLVGQQLVEVLAPGLLLGLTAGKLLLLLPKPGLHRVELATPLIKLRVLLLRLLRRLPLTLGEGGFSRGDGPLAVFKLAFLRGELLGQRLVLLAGLRPLLIELGPLRGKVGFDAAQVLGLFVQPLRFLLELLAAAGGCGLCLLRLSDNFGELRAQLTLHATQAVAMGEEEFLHLIALLPQRASEIITPGVGWIRL